MRSAYPVAAGEAQERIVDVSTRCLIYCRVSTDEQRDRGTSLESQEAACREYAAKQGWQVVDVVSESYSGGTFNGRPGLDRVRAMIRNGGVDAFLTLKTDRLVRPDELHLLAEFWSFEAELQDSGVDVAYVLETFESTPLGQLTKSIALFAAAQERREIRRRTKDGRTSILAKGQHPRTGYAPFGRMWERDRDNRRVRIVEDPDTAPVLRRIFAALDAGQGLRAVCRELQDAGIRTPRGGVHWHPSTLRAIVSSPTVIGQGTWTDPNDSDGRVALAADAYPPLVSPEQFNRVQQRLAVSRAEHSARADRPTTEGLLRGSHKRDTADGRRSLITCQSCGCKMIHATRRREGNQYRCNSDRCPSRTSVSVAALDAAIWRWIEQTMTSDRMVAEEMTLARRPDPTEQERAALTRRRRDVEKELQGYVNALAALVGNDHASAAVHVQLDRAGKELSGIDDRLTYLETVRAEWQREQASLADVAAFTSMVRDRIAACEGWADRRRLIEDLRISVTVWPHGSYPRWVAVSGTAGNALILADTRKVSSPLERTGHLSKVLPMRLTAEDAAA